MKHVSRDEFSVAAGRNAPRWKIATNGAPFRLRARGAPYSRLGKIVASMSLVLVGFGAVQGGAAINFVLGTNAAVLGPHSSWSCTTGTLFWETNGQLSTAQQPLKWTKVGIKGDQVDALGYSPFNHNLYAIDLKHGANYDKLVTVSPNGAQTVLGSVAGLPTAHDWVAGDVDPSTGTFYVSDGVSNIYAINVTAKTASPVTVPPTLALGEDLIIQKGWLWTVSNASVNGMSLTSTSTKAFAPYSPFVGLNSGSMWSLPGVNGLALRWNNTSKVVKITALRLATAIYHSLGKARSTGSPNDGATCTSQTTPGPDTAPVLKVVGNPTSGLFPGSSQSIDLSLINSYPTPLTAYARSIVLTLTSPNPSRSIAGNFVVNQSLTATVVAPGNATWSLSDLNIPIGKWPKISMLETGINQDACRGVVLTMHYTWRYAG